MSAPQVSVVIPSYNYGRFVCEAVDSALAQKDVTVEVIVIDDDSKDDTRERLAAYGDRITYVHQANAGVSAARNHGIRLARAERIGFLDADDVWHPELARTLLAAMDEQRLDGASARMTTDRASLPAPFPAHPTVHVIDPIELFRSSPLLLSGTIASRAAILDVGGFDTALRYCEDRDLWLRMSARYKLGTVDVIGFCYRLHPEQTIRHTQRMYDALKGVFARHFAAHPDPSLQQKAESFLHVDAALGFIEEGDRKDAVRHLVTSLVRYPVGASGEGHLATSMRLKLLVRLALGERVFHVLRRARS